MIILVSTSQPDYGDFLYYNYSSSLSASFNVIKVLVFVYCISINWKEWLHYAPQSLCFSQTSDLQPAVLPSSNYYTKYIVFSDLATSTYFTLHSMDSPTDVRNCLCCTNHPTYIAHQIYSSNQITLISFAIQIYLIRLYSYTSSPYTCGALYLDFFKNFRFPAHCITPLTTEIIVPGIVNNIHF